MSLTVDRLDHIVLNVVDAERVAAWYVGVLGMERRDFVARDSGERRIALHAGSQKINVRPVSADARGWIAAATPTPGSADLCFITTGPLQAALDHLRACGVEIVDGPVAREGALGAMTSLYCRDPERNLIEIAAYD